LNNKRSPNAFSDIEYCKRESSSSKCQKIVIP
jgi:hypothetical protein